MVLQADKILKFLITDDDRLNTIIMCKTEEIEILATDYDIYTALASVREYDEFSLAKLKKLFEVTDIQSYKHQTGKDKPILTEEHMEKLRQ